MTDLTTNLINYSIWKTCGAVEQLFLDASQLPPSTLRRSHAIPPWIHCQRDACLPTIGFTNFLNSMQKSDRQSCCRVGTHGANGLSWAFVYPEPWEFSEALKNPALIGDTKGGAHRLVEHLPISGSWRIDFPFMVKNGNLFHSSIQLSFNFASFEPWPENSAANIFIDRKFNFAIFMTCRNNWYRTRMGKCCERAMLVVHGPLKFPACI